MKLRFTNFLGLLAVLGAVAGLVGTGIYLPINPLLAVPFALLAVICIAIFVMYVYDFVYNHPLGEIPDDEAKEHYRDDD